MEILKQSTSAARSFMAIDSSGAPVTGKVNGDWTKSIAKNGGNGASMTVTITEDSNGKGRYLYTASSSHTDTVGELMVIFEASGVLQVNERYKVEAVLLADIAAATATAVIGFAFDPLDGSRTVKGVLRRIDALIKGKHTGMLGALWTLFGSDGTTVLVQAAQDIAAGTRNAASTVAGD